MPGRSDIEILFDTIYKIFRFYYLYNIIDGGQTWFRNFSICRLIPRKAKRNSVK